jgi:hypothetical protein
MLLGKAKREAPAQAELRRPMVLSGCRICGNLTRSWHLPAPGLPASTCHLSSQLPVNHLPILNLKKAPFFPTVGHRSGFLSSKVKLLNINNLQK